METESLAKGAKDAAKDAVKHQKTAGADQLGRMAGAVHGAAGALQEEMPTVASYIDDAASRMEHAAGTLRERSLEALLRDAATSDVVSPPCC